ncbi:MAG TPA: homoserine dehydrogenase [Gemmatimonadaceae bacterium]|nr:homoserine dehydrogenase [Gemmatimonadaceae bacterium]
MSNTVGVAVYGLGTVGSAAVEIMRSAGDGRFTLRHVVVRDKFRKRAIDCDPALITDDWCQPLHDPKVSLVVELMGGVDPACRVVRRALESGKHVVTANKALIATHGASLEAIADAYGVALRYEAAVGGAIPVIHTLRGTLKGNRITRIRGILNGTTNFMLTRMSADGLSFAEALREAQKKGFAEADPTADVSGLDTAQKLVILVRHAFGHWVPVECVERAGIEGVRPKEGEVFKLIAEAVLTDGSLRLRVGPQKLAPSDPMAHVNDENNAVLIEGDFAGSLTFIGRGAGALPTGSAVYDDIVAAVC